MLVHRPQPPNSDSPNSDSLNSDSPNFDSLNSDSPNFDSLNSDSPNSDSCNSNSCRSTPCNFSSCHSEQATHPSVTSKTKRLIDILGALVGVTITALVTLPIAIAMGLIDPGPIFYSQIRCGLNGKPFRIWKFRSMVVDAEQLKHLVQNEAKGHIFKNRHDPRITALGSWLRRTSLDELPQFWNVLRGEMSLVGTRPPTQEEVQHYDHHHFQRLQVKPGITGEWQANGRSQVKDFEEIVTLDLAYQQKWSIGYDVVLILKTFKAVVDRHGAY